MADRDVQSGVGGERGELDLPGPDPRTVRAAAVGADE